MPLAATHIIATVSLFDYLRPKYLAKNNFLVNFAFYAAVGSLLPDIDIPLGWLFKSIGLDFGHGTITHTPFFRISFSVNFDSVGYRAKETYIANILYFFLRHNDPSCFGLCSGRRRERRHCLALSDG